MKDQIKKFLNEEQDPKAIEKNFKAEWFTDEEWGDWLYWRTEKPAITVFQIALF
jgi:hypothetical protein